jgi:hypothetical protein
MSVIRFYTNEVFTTDSQEYEILHNAAQKIKGVEGAVVEIGTREGGSAKIIIDALVKNEDIDRNMFCIDPYGNIEYDCTNLCISAFSIQNRMTGKMEGENTSKEKSVPVKYDYNNAMRNKIVPSLYYYAFSAGLNFQFFFLEDTEFFDKFSEGVPCYNEFKTYVNKYAFVFFDGPHTNDLVKNEVEFFNERAVEGTVYVFDDIWMYSHDEVIEPILFANGFEILEKGKIKASYVRKN